VIRSLRWLTLLFLVVALIAAPAPLRSEDAPPALTPEEKAKRLVELDKLIRELEAQREALKLAPIKPTTPASSVPEGKIPAEYMKPFAWRCIGPANMGGRITAIAVNESDPSMYWVATGSGGLLKTSNNGTTFEFQFDKEATVSIGDVAVAASDAKIVWVGTGENNPRNSVSYGDGVYKSIDGGKSWQNMGLKKSFQIGKILIHPKNPDIVYVGALGRLYGPNEERGLFKTEDGGKNWKKVLYVDDKTGVQEMRFDPTDPNTLIVAMWERKRDEFDGFFGTPPVPDAYGPVVTHGPGSALYKTTDGGKNWKKLNDPTAKSGLPTVALGRIGLDYSHKTKGLLFAIIDTEKAGTGTQSPTFLGLVSGDAEGGGVKVNEVTADSPAAKGGLKNGDVIVKYDETKATTNDAFIDYFLSKNPGDKLALVVKRDGKDVTLEITLGKRAETTSPPMGNPPTLGIRLGQGAGLKISAVTPDSTAEKAGLKVDDAITAIDGNAVGNVQEFFTAIGTKKAGDKVKLTVKREKETKEIELVLAAPPPAKPAKPAKPFGIFLGGQQANVQSRQGKDGNQTGGVYVSKDNGETWKRVNSFLPRPMYFGQIRVDPTDDETIYVLGDVPTPLSRSTNGGAKFDSIATARGVHADAHAMWINPKDPRHFIVGTDGGFYITYDKGVKWDHVNTLPLGQFYHITVDTKRPYRVYGGLQDNGSWGGPSDSLRRSGPVNEDWIFVAGGDGFVCPVDPTDPDLVYAESQGGFMSKRNFRTGESAGLRPGPKPGQEPLRWNWNTPFILSSHNPSIFYSGSQYVFRSVKKGDDQKPISPELTRTKQGCIVALAESPKNPDVLWAGTDDGYLWITRDGGAKWDNVTTKLHAAGLPGHRWISTIEPSREKEGRAYVCVDAHRSDDDKPYLFVTEDFGVTWKAITSNLPAFGSTRCLREDIVNQSVLYCGTEFGAFVSANRGESWTPLGVGLPTVACHEFAQPTAVNDLVVGTHGRSIWVLDINAIRQMKPETLKEKAVLFAPAPAVRWKFMPGGEFPYSSTDRKFIGQNPARGAAFDYILTEKAKEVSLRVVDVSGKIVREFRQPATSPGLHRLTWDLSGSATGGVARSGRAIGGGQVPPGAYLVMLKVDDKEFKQTLVVELDPNAPKDLVTTEGELEAIEAERKALKPKLPASEY